MRLWGQLFFVVWGSKSFVDTLLRRIFPSDQKHSTRHCIKFADVEYLGLNVDSREKKLKVAFADTESRKSARNELNFVKSHFR